MGQSSDPRAEYLKEAQYAREQAKLATTEALRTGFLKLAEDWERLARTHEDPQVVRRGP